MTPSGSTSRSNLDSSPARAGAVAAVQSTVFAQRVRAAILAAIDRAEASAFGAAPPGNASGADQPPLGVRSAADAGPPVVTAATGLPSTPIARQVPPMPSPLASPGAASFEKR